MIKLILFLIAFFGFMLFFKAVRLIFSFRRFTSGADQNLRNDDNVTTGKNSKYSNVQDVEYTEITDGKDKKSN